MMIAGPEQLETTDWLFVPSYRGIPASVEIKRAGERECLAILYFNAIDELVLVYDGNTEKDERIELSIVAQGVKPFFLEQRLRELGGLRFMDFLRKDLLPEFKAQGVTISYYTRLSKNTTHWTSEQAFFAWMDKAQEYANPKTSRPANATLAMIEKMKQKVDEYEKRIDQEDEKNAEKAANQFEKNLDSFEQDAKLNAHANPPMTCMLNDAYFSLSSDFFSYLRLSPNEQLPPNCTFSLTDLQGSQLEIDHQNKEIKLIINKKNGDIWLFVCVVDEAKMAMFTGFATSLAAKILATNQRLRF